MLGLVLWGQALSCAYYGIFAGLMVGLGTLSFAISRGLWRSPRYWILVALAAAIAIGLTTPFFLPYLDVQKEGFGRTVADARAYSANAGAWLASSAWAHRWWLPAIEGFNETLFPGILTTVLGSAGAWVALRPTAAGAPVPIPLARDVAVFYLLVAATAFWASFGPDAGLYRVLFETLPVFAFLRAPARMGLMVPLALVVLGSAVLAPWLRARRSPRVWALAAALLAALELNSAPLTAMRDAPPVPEAYRVLARLPRGPVAEFPYFYRRIGFSEARGVHAGVDGALAAVGQRLQRLHSPRVASDGVAPQFVPHTGIVPDSQWDRRALRGVPSAVLRQTQPRTAARASADVRPVSATARYSRTTCGCTKSSTGRTSREPASSTLVDGATGVAVTWAQRLGALTLCAALAVLHTWPLARDLAGQSRLDNADTALNTWVVAWVARELPRHPTHVFDAPIFHPESRTLAYAEHLLAQGVMAIPLRAAGLSATATYNMLVLIGLTLSAWAMWMLVTHWTGDVAAGAVAGLAFAFNAHLLTRFAHLQALHPEFVPVVLLALDAVVARARWRDGLLLGCGLALVGLTSIYLLTFVAGAVCVGLLARTLEWRAHPRATLTSAAIGVAVGIDAARAGALAVLGRQP